MTIHWAAMAAALHERREAEGKPTAVGQQIRQVRCVICGTDYPPDTLPGATCPKGHPLTVLYCSGAAVEKK